MDNLHTVLRAIQNDKPEIKSKPDHLTVFREFLAHLDDVQRKAAKVVKIAKAPRAKSSKRKPPKRGKS